MEFLEKLSLAGLVPVIAVNDADDAVPLCKALAEGGLPVAEITFRTAAAEESIRRVAKELPDVLVRVLTEVGARRVGVPAGLDNSWLSRFDGEVVVDSPTVPAPLLGDLDGVVTASAVSCAETGTIFLDGSPDQGRAP